MKTSRFKERSASTLIARWSAALLVASGMHIMALPRLQAETTKMQISDTGITAVVERGIKHEKGLVADDVDVSTSQGIVTLSGSVGNVFAKDRTVRIAESFRGVRGVIDQIGVTPVSRPDEEIHKDILAALRQDPATESYQVTVSVQDAVATLAGSVGSNGEKELAARIAEGIKGVKQVRNDVAINYLAKATDTQIANDIKARLQWDIWINGELINPAVKEGKVTLSGTIGSTISKSRALEDAWVYGVTSVDGNGLKVEPRASKGAHQEHEFASRSDSEIKKAILAALHLDPRVSAFSLAVTVEDGGVILGGNVGNLKAKTAAEQDAKNIVGVWRVDDLLNVRAKEQYTDAEMEKQLKAALAWDSALDDSEINVTVSNHIATLSGSVDSGLQKAEAQDVASRAKGVLSIRNHLKAEPQFANYYYNDRPYYGYDDSPYYSGFSGGPYSYQALDYDLGVYEPQLYLTDAQIKKGIKDEFFWSPFVDSDDIKIAVSEGVATLTGTVGTKIGSREAENDAYEGGASAVVDQVKVKHSAWWWKW